MPPTPNFLLTLNAIHFLLAEMFKQSNCVISVMIIGNFLHLLIVVLPPFVIEFYPPRVFWQVQAAIKKKVEKQKKQVEMGVVEAFSSNTRPKVKQKRNKPIQSSNCADGGEEDDEEEPAETGEPKEKEEIDLEPIVASVFGQVRPQYTPSCSSCFNPSVFNLQYLPVLFKCSHFIF